MTEEVTHRRLFSLLHAALAADALNALLSEGAALRPADAIALATASAPREDV